LVLILANCRLNAKLFVKSQPVAAQEKNKDLLKMFDGLQIDRSPGEEDVKVVRDGLDRFNFASQRNDYSSLRYVLRDDDRKVVAGLLGSAGWGWLYIEILWVSDGFRGEGIGARLLTEAEDEARRLGCHGACLSTFSFQAKPFYEKHGYSVFGELPDYPSGELMYFMQKKLRGATHGTDHVT
jgi:GNAT superfamily N-acetyltransferase